MSEPRTHYQISLTSRQAVGLFFLLLLSLGVAFFFGLMTGLSGRSPGSPDRTDRVASTREGPAEALPPIETAVPTAVSSRTSRNVIGAAAAPAEATPPASLRPFEDGIEEETAASATPPTSAEGAGSRGGAAPATAGAGGAFWVQVEALTSRRQANA